jgi:hypothetical protein
MLKNDVPLLVSTLNKVARTLIADLFSGILYVRSRIHSVLSRTKDWGRMSTVLTLAHMLISVWPKHRSPLHSTLYLICYLHFALLRVDSFMLPLL